MILAVKSWKLREAARTAIGTGKFDSGFELAVKAQKTHRTREGEAIRIVNGGLGMPESRSEGLVAKFWAKITQADI